MSWAVVTVLIGAAVGCTLAVSLLSLILTRRIRREVTRINYRAFAWGTRIGAEYGPVSDAPDLAVDPADPFVADVLDDTELSAGEKVTMLRTYRRHTGLPNRDAGS